MKKTKTLTAFVLACFAVIAAVAVIASKSKKADAAEATQYIYRISGESRYETAIKVADELKNYTGVSRFDSVVIASGLSFPDALAMGRPVPYNENDSADVHGGKRPKALPRKGERRKTRKDKRKKPFGGRGP